MNQDRIIGEVARRNGVLLDRDDPVMIVMTAMEVMAQDHAEWEAKLTAILDRSDAVTSGKVAKAAVAGLPDAVDRLVRQRTRRMALGAAAVLCAAVLAGAGAGYWFRGAVPVLVGVRAGAERCEDKLDGSRLCWIPLYERMPGK